VFLFTINQIQAQLLSEQEIATYTKAIQENADSSVQVAYQLAIHHKRQGEVETYKQYCLYIIEKTKENPTSYYSLRALRAIAIIHVQALRVDSMHYYTDKIIEATNGVEAPEFLRFRGMAYNVKAGEHLYITMPTKSWI
jgi:hypothetical protein